MYRVGWPGWKIAAHWGAPLLVKLDVLHDKEAGVFVVTSRDLAGLVVEFSANSTAENAHREIQSCVEMLMEEALSSPPKVKPITAWPGEFSLA